MRERLLGKLKQNKAYTLLEMLVVVAVMVVLMGISILGLQEYTTAVQMTELDNYAKTIYLEAQNRLIAQKVDGGISRLAVNFESNRVENKLSEEPSDYPDARGEEWRKLYYVGKTDAYSEDIIPKQSYIFDEVNDYIIEFNPNTGIVYGVFCWEKDTTIDYNNDIVTLESREKEDRTSARIGYYGGAQSETLGESAVLNQKVELINDEELYLKISYPKTVQLSSSLGDSLSITYEISDDADGNPETGNTWTDVIEPGDLVGTEAKTSNVYVKNAIRNIEVYILLDSLQEGLSITDIINTNFDWNNELTISVTSSFNNGAGVYKEVDVVSGHGLYANDTGVFTSDFDFAVGNFDIDIEEEDEVEKRLEKNTQALIKERYPSYSGDVFYVEIENLRHLRNLDKFSEESSLIVVGITDEIDFLSEEFNWMKTEDGFVVMSTDAINPLATLGFEPITNSNITNPAIGLVVEGNNSAGIRNSVFQNFVINGTNGVGIWSSTDKVCFSNIVIEDITVSGENQVGALVGSMRDGDMNNCGVYLTTFTRKSGLTTYYNQVLSEITGYNNEMDYRCDTYKIKGTSNVGGLVGTIENVNVEGCYAAIQVEATGNNIGGLIGKASSTEDKYTIKSSYASGEIIGGSNVGGFIGSANNMKIGATETENELTNIYGVYATGDVYANVNFGGFAGKSTDSIYEACTAYGAIEEKSGTKRPVEVNGGGFIGATSGDVFNNSCTYLTQIGHNDDVNTIENITSKAYKDYLANNTNDLTAGTSFPYEDDLNNKSFPFAEGWAGQPHHYGDWPAQYVINTSLVYYEKYQDNSYGFYSITHLAGSDTQWLLNNLRDEVVIDDGYAFLSKYNLQSVKCNLEIGSVIESDANAAEFMKKGIVLPVVSSDAVEDGALIKLQQQGKLEFFACDGKTGEKLTGAQASSFEVSGMYFYQMPYDLQCTDRYGVENFYDRFTIEAGYLYDGDKDASNDISIIKDMTFFYCPHFAKTAINPNVNEDKDFDDTAEDLDGADNNHSLMDDKYPNPSEVAVRSARQLNALGRFPYYWNRKSGAPVLAFEQEVDIDFGEYVKTYCGKEFNLLAFDRPYSNQPIGQTDGSDYGAFMNDYDGNYHKIIDYCVKSDEQYVGLFGEVYKGEKIAERTQIENIVMVVSDKKNLESNGNYLTEKDPLKQNNAGIIIGTYLDDTSNTTEAGLQRKGITGVGALVGFDYNIGQTNDEHTKDNPGVPDNKKIYTTHNCAVSGYDVEYHLGEYVVFDEQNNATYHMGAPKEKKAPIGIAVGGFIGYGRGNISHCTSSNNVKFMTNLDYTGDDVALFMGGFAGSYYYGTIWYCYSGGTIDADVVDANDTTHYVNRIRVGGLCPGWLDARGIETPASGNEWVRYSQIYTYTDISKDMRDIYEKASGNRFKYAMPIVGRMKVVRERNNWTTESQYGSTTGVRVPGMSYYLQPVYEWYYNQVGDEVKEYFEEYWQGWIDSGFVYTGWVAKTCDPISYENLSNETWIEQNAGGIPVDIHKVQGVEYTYPDSTYLKGIIFPFPAVVTDAEGNYVHYGDWIVDSMETVTANYPTYYERYQDDNNQDAGYGYYYVKEDGTVVNTLITDDSLYIAETGYGYVTCVPTEAEKGNAPFTIDIQNKEDGGTYKYYMVPTPLETTSERSMVIPEFNYGALTAIDGVFKTKEDSTEYDVASSTKDIYVNPAFAAAISLDASELGTESKPLWVRTQEQLLAVDDFADTVTDIKMVQTHSVYLDDSYASVSVKATHTFDGNGYEIRNGKTTIFDSNNGLIKNVLVTNSNITNTTDMGVAVFVNTNNGTIEYSGVRAAESYDETVISGQKAYGFAANNAGTIQYAYMVGTVNGQSEAAGFVGVNTGTITNSYANTKVSASGDGASAAGFAIIGGTIEKSYAAGNVNATTAYGFMLDGNATSCYTISEVLGNSIFGFAGANTGSTCFWTYDRITEYNTELIQDINNPPSDAISLRELMRNPANRFGVDDFGDEVSPDYPYSNILGNDYPYPSVGLEHCGDWKAPSVENANDDVEERELESGYWKHVGIFYYERYMDGSYGVYAKGIQPNDNRASVVINTLADAGEPVISSGYGVFYYNNGYNRNWYVNRGYDITDFDANVLEGFAIPGLDENYVFRFMNNDTVQDAVNYWLLHANSWTSVNVEISRNEINNARPRE